MYRQRILSARLSRLVDAFPVVVVSGARQVGKTTLLRHLYPDHDDVVFDASLDIENARRDPDLFLKNHPAPAILDEIQYAPEVVGAIKRHVDRRPGQPGQYLLTGVQQWQVMRALSESLAGRAAFLDLRGFSQEIAGTGAYWLTRWLDDPDDFLPWTRHAEHHNGNLADWLWRGSLPRATEIDAALIPDYWAGYHRTYVERDARLAGSIEDWQDFGRFVRRMSALTAQEINSATWVAKSA